MEERKDATAEGGLSVASGLHTEVGPSAASGLHAASEPRAQSGLCADGAQIAASVSGVANGRNMAVRLFAKGRRSTESRFRIASGLRVQDDVADAYMPHCDKCKQPILRLETYIVVGDVTLCDGCYMNMDTGEFLAKIGGELRVME